VKGKENKQTKKACVASIEINKKGEKIEERNVCPCRILGIQEIGKKKKSNIFNAMRRKSFQ
jgi:hypothetical protein